MKKLHVLLCLMIAGIILSTGCITRPGGVAPSNVPIDGRSYRVVGNISNADSRIYLLGLIPISGENSIRDAIDKGVRSRRGDAMINITVESYSQYWILFTRFTTRVEGDVIRFEREN